MQNFWQDLKKPFTVLAPLDGVTDFVFRQMMAKIGKPDVLFTEFTTCDGLQSKGHDKVALNFKFGENERPVVAQIWGLKPENFFKTAQYVSGLGFSGIDLNMGCPSHDITKIGACSGLIKNPNLAKELIQATREGAGNIPVSVKTRIGFEKQKLEWIEFLLHQNLPILTVHLRTVAELSRVPAHWELMPQILEIRDSISKQTLIVGNGDISSLEDITQKFEQYGCDGFMVGRGVLHNPWFFSKENDIPVEKRFETFLEHIDLYEKTWEGKRNFDPLKKFCKAYINNFPGASELREEIMQTHSLDELKETVSSMLQSV